MEQVSQRTMNIILDMMEYVALAGHSGRLFNRQLEMVNYILERLEDLSTIFMRFLRVSQIFERESGK